MTLTSRMMIKEFPPLILSDVAELSERQMSVVKPVVRLIRNHHQKILSLTLRGSSRDELLGTTALHPFYVRGHGWVKAGDLHTGDEIVSEEGGVLKVRRVQQRAGLADTYNFEVADTHTYFVGTLHAWVHNACKKGRKNRQEASRTLSELKLPNDEDIIKFYDEIIPLSPGERVAKIRVKAQKIADDVGLQKMIDLLK